MEYLKTVPSIIPYQKNISRLYLQAKAQLQHVIPSPANSACWHIDWAQFNWSQQTAIQGVTWELGKSVPGQYACRNLLG